jgi:hypothetical protein
MAAVALASAPAYAEDADFRFLVRRIESEYQTRRLHIPLFGVARFMARPFGVRGLNLAIWEDLSYRRTHGEGLRAVTEDFAARGWKPMVRVHEAGRESVQVFAKPEGKDMRLLVLTVDDETVMVQMKVDPRRVLWILGEPRLAAARAVER